MGNTKKVGTVVGIGIAVAIAAFVIVGFALGNPLLKIPKQYTASIISSTISVDAGKYAFYTFSAPTGASNAAVSGTFNTGGGSGNDIKVEILDIQNFFNLKNGQQVNALYSAGPGPTGNINANVPTGQTLYLVYDNTFSANSTKQVTTDVNLTYTSK